MTTSEIREALAAIATGKIALSAEVEYELEERGLIVQDHRPYAHLTTLGRAVLEEVAAVRER